MSNVKIDQSKLLGFRLLGKDAPRGSAVSAKIGDKLGGKSGLKAGPKVGFKIGAKEGRKESTLG